MEQETRRTVNTHRRCAAYPPGLGVNSKAECRRRMGVRGRERESRSSQRKEDTRVNINAPSIQNMHCVHSVNVSLHVLLEEHFIHSFSVYFCLYFCFMHSCTCVCVPWLHHCNCLQYLDRPGCLLGTGPQVEGVSLAGPHALQETTYDNVWSTKIFLLTIYS